MTSVAALVALIVFFGASFFFALAETSLFALGKWQVHQLQGQSPRAGGVINSLLSTPQDLLATLVLGNSFANGGIVGVMFWVVTRQQWPMGVTMLGVLLLILFGAGRAKGSCRPGPGIVGASRGPAHESFA